MDNLLTLRVSGEQKTRLDVYLAEYLEEYSRSYIQKIIKQGLVTVNKKPAIASCKVCDGDMLEIIVPEITKSDIVAQKIPLDILYRDNDIAVVNKPRGMVVHPGAGNPTDTLVNALLYHMKEGLSDINGVERPGIVHRIDKDTSGILVIAKNNNSHRILSDMFANRQVEREYVAICKGYPGSDKGKIDAPVARDKYNRLKMAVDASGRQAITYFEVMQRSMNSSYIKARLESGRTHQIRVHMAFLGAPILGDDVYGGTDKRFKKGQLLHSGRVCFTHPVTDKTVEFTCGPDEYFNDALAELNYDG